jgi:[acyl-carrier-protein] S-malonyltransferase
MTTPSASANSIAFVFPGQGSQAVGMGKELAEKYPLARQTLLDADQALGYCLSETCFEGPEERLRLTEITQPAILAVSVAVARILRANGLEPAFVAGHSLGEYSAQVAAGTMDFRDALRVVRNRGQYMQEAVPVGVGAMAAILGLNGEAVGALCREAAQAEVCEVANFNSPEQIVISGHTAAIERAASLATARGAKKAKILTVSAPFHCSLMKPAQDRLAADLGSLTLRQPAVPVVSNVDAAVLADAEGARDALIRQVTGAVKWEQSIRLLIARGVRTFVEVGPGRVLWGLMRQIDKSQTALYVGDAASLEKALEHFASVRPGFPRMAAQ